MMKKNQKPSNVLFIQSQNQEKLTNLMYEKQSIFTIRWKVERTLSINIYISTRLGYV